MSSAGKQAFCEQYIHLRQQPISFAGRPYLPAIYASTRRRLVIRASRQVEKSTFLVNTILHYATFHRGIHVIFVCPREEQARVFSSSRLVPVIQESPVLARLLLGPHRRRPQVKNLRFVNGSEVYIRAAYHSADAVRGIDGDVLLVDEFQDIADGDLPVLEEALSHSPLRRVLLTGTPKTVDNHLEAVFEQSTAHEFLVPCPACGSEVRLDEDCLGPHGPVCPMCLGRIDPGAGRWVPRHPDSTWGDGFWINHLMVPWVNYQELLERQRTYDPARFRNECLGLSSVLGDHIVSRAEVEACCSQRPMMSGYKDVPPQVRTRLVAGIDWGGGGVARTVLVIGYLTDRNQFVVCRAEHFPVRATPDQILTAVAERCEQFHVCAVAADGGGNGTVYNPLLLARLPKIVALYAILYSASDHVPRQHQGRLWYWTVGRTASLGTLFARIKKMLLDLPRRTDFGTFVNEICCEVAEYDDQQRGIKYSHPETQPDDTLHALNYAALIGRRWCDGQLLNQ